MSKLSPRIEAAISKYGRNHISSPTYIAVSVEFMYGLAQELPPSYRHAPSPSFYGLPIKFVKRRNYVEAMPRSKSVFYYRKKYPPLTPREMIGRIEINEPDNRS